MKNTPSSVRSQLRSFAGPLPQFVKATALAGLFVLGGTLAPVLAQEINIGSGEIFVADIPGQNLHLVIDTITLTIAPTGQLNMQGGAMIVRNDNFAKIYGYLVTGYNLGAWNGPGINSSVAANDLQHRSGVGIIDNAEAHFPSFEGRPTPTNIEIFVKFGLYGDANLDGDVNALDVALMGTGNGIGWYHGDFNYDGTVNAADYALLNAALPEPGSMFLLLAGAAVVGSRRKRRG